MRPQNIHLKPIFVDYIPSEVESGHLYISMKFATAAHKCACGCGNEVITPLSPTDWKMTFDGKSVSLHPSIGNWSFNCRSHYWVKQNRIAWASAWSSDDISENRAADKRRKDKYYQTDIETGKNSEAAETGMSIWKKLKKFLAS